MKIVCITSGVAILAVAISIGFIRVDEADYMRWRLIFAAGEGLAIAAGGMLIAFGALNT